MTNTYDTTVVQELFGIPNLIVQKRKDFFVSFPFLSIDEAKQKLHDLSHNPDETYILYNVQKNIIYRRGTCGNFTLAGLLP